VWKFTEDCMYQMEYFQLEMMFCLASTYYDLRISTHKAFQEVAKPTTQPEGIKIRT
ncbi:hypothetical protein TNCT_710211, partial [Trichonephila clavata]